MNNPKEYYKVALTIPFVDHIIQQLKDRFSNLPLYEGFSIMPEYIFTDEAKVKNGDQLSNWKIKFRKFLKPYVQGIPAMSNLYAQLDMWEIHWKKYEGKFPTNLSDLIKMTDKTIFPTIHEALRILATIPVTSCTCERSISGLRRLKTWLRNRLSEERLNSLSLLMFNRDIDVDIDWVIDAVRER